MYFSKIRVYFNKSKEAPQVWSIDEGTVQSEINIQGVKVYSGSSLTHFNAEAQYPEPKAWLEFHDIDVHFGDGYAFLKKKQ